VYYEVYVDVLFFENLWMNLLLLGLTAWVWQETVKVWRMILAACIGSLGACVLVIASSWMSGAGYFLGAFVLAAGMAGIAFSGKKHFFTRLFSLYIESFVLNGILRYFGQFHSLAKGWILVFGSLSALLLLIAQYLWKQNKRQQKLVVLVSLVNGSSRISVDAFYDTGNGLYDPFSGKPVSILAEELLNVLLKESKKEMIPRMIPYQTISQSGVLKAYILDQMVIQHPDGERILERPIIACMPGEKRQYQLILHRDLL